MMGMQLNFDRHSKPSEGIFLSEDLTVWKIGKVEANRFVSRYNKFTYYKNEATTHVNLKPIKDPDRLFYIREGYHAFLTKEMADFFAKIYPKEEHETVAEFVIPEGSVVYYECFGKQIAASKIIFVD